MRRGGQAMQSRAFSGLPVIGLLTLVYFIAGKFGLMLASLHASASPVWPPAGIALAALLLLGYRAWPAIFVGAFLVNVTTAGNVATSLAIASGNTLEALCGAWLVNRFAGGTTAFDRPQGVVKFALAAVVSTIISPVFGVTSLALGGFVDWANFGAIWLTWWLGDTTGDLLIAPLIILWSIASKWRWNRREAVEVGILLLLLVVLSEAVFGGWLTISARNYPIAFISGPIVIWTAFRFTQRETATSIFILSAIAIWGALHGFGPFVGETENQSLLGLQSWTAVLTITAMALSAGMAERGRAEEALRESEANMSLAANAANLGLWVWNVPGGDERWVTEKWRQLFGFADSEPVTFDRFHEVVHPGDSERVKQVVQHLLEHGGEYEIDYRITRPDGSIRWIASHGSVELDERGKPVLVRGVSRDVTKRKIAEEELRESEERFRTVANAAPVMIWMSGTEKLYTFFNKGWLEFTGRTMEQELGNGWSEGIHSDDMEHCLKIYGSSFDAWQPFTMEYRLRRNDGEYRWVLDSGTPRFASDGAFLGYIGSCFDITERKLAEEKFRLVLDAAPNAMIMVDSAGVINFANAPAATVFGYPLSELIGRPIETLIPERFRDGHAGYRKGFLSEPSSRAMGAGRDLFGCRKDGSEFPVEVGLNPIRTAPGLFVLASVIDITARKQAELEQQLQHMELARVGRVAVMGELAASLAHEVNNPIAAIVSNASAGQRLIATGKIETKELNHLLADIVADGRRAGEIVQGVRNMVRKTEARRSLVQINDTIDDLFRIVRADALRREVTVAAEVDSDGVRVLADRAQLLQVLLNLTINAFEAMSAMRPDARRVVIHAGRNENGEIIVSVRDTGPGFPGGIVEQLFEPFFSTKAEGTGMGLAISRSIIEAHGGTLAGENCDGGGACFTVRLPEAKEDKSTAA
jgi:two-component system sensor kinase FixL